MSVNITATSRRCGCPVIATTLTRLLARPRGRVSGDRVRQSHAVRAEPENAPDATHRPEGELAVLCRRLPQAAGRHTRERQGAGFPNGHDVALVLEAEDLVLPGDEEATHRRVVPRVAGVHSD